MELLAQLTVGNNNGWITLACLVLVSYLGYLCLCILANVSYQPRNVGDDDLLTVKDFDNDRQRD